MKTDRPDPYLNPNSIESRFRAKRFVHFEKLIEEEILAKGSVRVLDIGGTEQYWSIAAELFAKHPNAISVHLVNAEIQPIRNTSIFSQEVGDACDSELLKNDFFDIVHSNSVIEHVGDWDRIDQFSRNVKRLGRRYFVQTPNYWFPLEPHFRFPGFQWLPVSVRAWLLKHRTLGFYDQQKTKAEALEIVESIRLLKTAQMKRLFEGGDIIIEKVFGLNKSIVAVGQGIGASRKDTQIRVAKPEYEYGRSLSTGPNCKVGSRGF